MSARTPGFGHRHSVFGLTIASQLPLPELPSDETGGEADVHVRLGEVAPVLPDSQPIESDVTARPGALLLDLETARFLIRNGREIVIQPGSDSTERDVRAYLLGSAMGALLHQRGILPLHANAIEIDGRAIAFAGPSGAGKSTLAAYFRAQARRLLCDDVCAVTFDKSGRALAWPGIPRIKLWGDAAVAFGFRSGDLERVVNWEDKFSLPLTLEAPCSPLPLARVYVLKAVETDPGIDMLTGAAAFDAAASNVYRPEFAAPLGQTQALFANTLALLRSAEVYVAERRLGFDVFQTEAERLERHITVPSTFSAMGVGEVV